MNASQNQVLVPNYFERIQEKSSSCHSGRSRETPVFLKKELPSTGGDSAPDIAIFLRDLYGGGAERVMLNLAQQFAANRLTVHVVIARTQGHYTSQLPSAAQLFDLKTPHLLGAFYPLVKYLRAHRPKTLLTALHYPCEIATLAKQFSGVDTRIVLSEHNHLSVEAKKYKQLSVRLTPWAAKLVYPLADKIVAVSQGVASDLARVTQLDNHKIEVVYNPLIDSTLAELADRPVDHPWLQPHSPPTLVAAGRLAPQKDFSTLIQAFARVRQSTPVKLIILGEGPEQLALQQLVDELGIGDDVDMPGFVKNPYVYMKRAAAFVSTSRWEGLSNVLVEAMAVGAPIVATDCPSGPAEVLAGGRYGWLAPVGDSEAIARAILTILAGEQKTVDRDWLTQFTIDYASRRYLEVLGFC